MVRQEVQAGRGIVDGATVGAGAVGELISPGLSALRRTAAARRLALDLRARRYIEGARSTSGHKVWGQHVREAARSRGEVSGR
ncbi:MAG: hypothetical protein U0841_04320 [Chloroflexia bacterium]